MTSTTADCGGVPGLPVSTVPGPLVSTVVVGVVDDVGTSNSDGVGGMGACILLFFDLPDLITGFSSGLLLKISFVFDLVESFKMEAPTAFSGFFPDFSTGFFDLDLPRSGTTSSLNLTIRSSLGLSEVSSLRKISLRFSSDEFLLLNLENRFVAIRREREKSVLNASTKLADVLVRPSNFFLEIFFL